jgi:hypothetical protein
MKLAAHRVDLKRILPFRELFLQETNFQIRYNACHERGWTDSYLLTIDDVEAGYGSIKGQEIPQRDTIFEFYTVPAFRKLSSQLFRELIGASSVNLIECQSNDLLLTSILFEFAQNINADVMLFEDHVVTEHVIPDVIFRPRRENESVFEHKVEPIGEYVLELGGEVVATGGFALHYNMPFSDLYMEVREDLGRKGLGSYILQELKKASYLAGRVPAARCSIQNFASRAALQKAGLRPCGFMLRGEVKPDFRTFTK